MAIFLSSREHSCLIFFSRSYFQQKHQINAKISSCAKYECDESEIAKWKEKLYNFFFSNVEKCLLVLPSLKSIIKFFLLRALVWEFEFCSELRSEFGAALRHRIVSVCMFAQCWWQNAPSSHNINTIHSISSSPPDQSIRFNHEKSIF